MFFFNTWLSRIPEAYARREAVMISVFYGLLLYMGIDLFMSEGLFRGLKLLFILKSSTNTAILFPLGLLGLIYVRV